MKRRIDETVPLNYILNFHSQHDGIPECIPQDDPADHPRVGEEHEHPLDETEHEPASDIDGAAHVDRARREI